MNGTRYRVVDTWNGGKGGRRIAFTSGARGTAGHNECFVWLQKNTSYSYEEATKNQGWRVEPVPERPEPPKKPEAEWERIDRRNGESMRRGAGLP